MPLLTTIDLTCFKLEAFSCDQCLSGMKISVSASAHSEVHQRNVAGALRLCAAPEDADPTVVPRRVCVLRGGDAGLPV